MLNAGTITSSIENTFKANAAMIALGFRDSTIERGDYVNMDPDRTPWVGIYRTKIDYNPRALGKHESSWEGVITIKLLVQATHMLSGAACEDRLESYIVGVLNAVSEDPTWNNVVDMITGFTIEYSYKETDESSIYFQWAMITLTAEASTG